MKKQRQTNRYDKLHAKIRKRKRNNGKRRKAANLKDETWAMDCKGLMQEAGA